jgi:hypothetical protein
MEIVFVHLNTRLPRYLRSNLLAHIEKFPGHRVTLIHSAGIEIPALKGLNLVPATEDSRVHELSLLYSHPKEFRSNFWLTSSARLFALENYMMKVQTEIIHVESDVIIARDFPFRKFSELKDGLAFPLISNSRGVASVVYLRDTTAANLLSSTLISEARKNAQTTEMLSLMEVYKSNPSQIFALPIGNDNPNFYRNIDSARRQVLIENFKSFDGIFDGVEIGQYFCGTDPRNRRGKKLIRHDLVDGYVNVKNLELRFDSRRRFINVSEIGSEKIEFLFAIHVPSKENRIFKSDTQERALREISQQSMKGSSAQTSLNSLSSSVLKSIWRRLKVLRILGKH